MACTIVDAIFMVGTYCNPIPSNLSGAMVRLINGADKQHTWDIPVIEIITIVHFFILYFIVFQESFLRDSSSWITQTVIPDIGAAQPPYHLEQTRG